MHLFHAFKFSKHSLGTYIGFGFLVLSFLISLLPARPVTIPQSVVALALPTVSASPFFSSLCWALRNHVGLYNFYKYRDTPSVRLQNTDPRGKFGESKRAEA